MARDPVCISCGQATGPGPRLNRFADGRPCPACRDRILDALPPALPSSLYELSFEEWGEDGDEPDDDFPRSA